MAPYAQLEALWERLSGDARRGVPLLQSTRKRLLTFTAFLTFVVALLWVALTGAPFITERPLFALLCASTPFAFLPFPYLVLRTNANLDLLAHIYLATLYLIVVLVASFLGGAVSTTSFFLVLIPLLASLLLGLNTGVVWVGVVALSFAALHLFRYGLPMPAFDLVGEFPNDYVSAQEVSLWNAIMMTLIALAASASVGNFRAVVSRSSGLLVRAARETKDAQNAQAVAEELSRSRSELMANVSHELRTPLNAIIGYSELLIETARERGSVADVSDNEHVLNAARRLSAMVNDMLKLSAIDSGRTPVQIDEVDVTGLVDDVIEALKPAVSAGGNSIECVVSSDVGVCTTDGDKLDACLRGLITHSLRFTKNGRVLVRVSKQDDRDLTFLRLEVEDSGVTVEAERLRALFEPFAHSENDTTQRFDGANLALALVKRTVQLLGGDVTAAEGSAGGVRFILRVPVGGRALGQLAVDQHRKQ